MDKLWTSCIIFINKRLQCSALFAFVMLLTLAGCRKEPGNQYMLWPASIPEADSLMESIEKAYAQGGSVRAIDSLTRRLEDVAASNPGNKLVAARAHYCRARFLSGVDSYADSARNDVASHVEQARRLYSEIDAPDYDLFRLKYTGGKVGSRTYSEIYSLNRDILEESLAFGDSLSMAGALNNIGNVLCSVGDTLAAITYLERSAEVFRKMNLPVWEAKINLSVAIACRSRDLGRSLRIMRSLYKDRGLMADTAFRLVLLHSLSVATQDIRYLKELTLLAAGNPEYDNVRAVGYSHVALSLIENPSTRREGLLYADSAAETMTPGIRSDYSSSIYQAKALAEKLRGNTGYAYEMLDRYASSKLESYETLLRGDVMRQENLNRIKQLESLQKDKENRNRLIFVSVLFSLVIVGLLVIMIVFRHNKRLQVSKMKADLELTRNRLQLASSRLALEENDNAMEKAIDTISRLRDSDKISRTDASVVNSALKAQLSNREELDSFQEIYRRLDPNFNRRLKERCPDISEGQLRMAAYIAMGMNNRQIGRVMSIEYQSVIKARHRLRARLGLDKSDSLEDFLRAFSGFENNSGPE